ncbi:hypothetical protein BTO13_01410 [Polaribacter gangjinensis]|uniref:Uncharacterized protein n=1 Tax=Polaribacter gangjinensis TaxID=574710 RepID=A0A2S7W9V8_9FLAO|nr:hypothetical protein BTO13_01410 [Polaribacter gangjinensis]
MFNSKEYYQKKTAQFIENWSRKRRNKVRFTLIESFYYSFFFSLIFAFFLQETKNIISTATLFVFITSFIMYFLVSYFLLFSIYENRYQRLTKENKH